MDYNHPKKSNNLIRLHPKEGGINIQYGNQLFQYVSPDLYIGLNLLDLINPYIITHKLNLSIAVNPKEWSTKSFFSYLTQAPDGDDPFDSKVLAKTKKCVIHGDKKTHLHAHENLMRILDQADLIKLNAPVLGFDIQGARYVYHSVGVACNPNYAAVSQRQDNPVENKASHFEIKFKKESNDIAVDEFLCLNIHLMAESRSGFGRDKVLSRLEQAIRLFYSELSLLHSKSPYHPQTNLKSILNATVDNYKDYGLSCQHPRSLEVLNQRDEVIEYSATSRKSTTLSLFTPAPAVTPAPAELKRPSGSWAKIAGAKAVISASKTNSPCFFNTDSTKDFPVLGQVIPLKKR